MERSSVVLTKSTVSPSHVPDTPARHDPAQLRVVAVMDDVARLQAASGFHQDRTPPNVPQPPLAISRFLGWHLHPLNFLGVADKIRLNVVEYDWNYFFHLFQ